MTWATSTKAVPCTPSMDLAVDRSPPTSEEEGQEADADDVSSTNVGDLSVDNAMPVSFSHLTGHFTEALISTAAGGSDQTASWGGTPVVRPAMGTAVDAVDGGDYVKLDGITEGYAGRRERRWHVAKPLMSTRASPPHVC